MKCLIVVPFFAAINRVDLSIKGVRDKIKAEVTGNTFTTLF